MVHPLFFYAFLRVLLNGTSTAPKGIQQNIIDDNGKVVAQMRLWKANSTLFLLFFFFFNK